MKWKHFKSNARARHFLNAIMREQKTGVPPAAAHARRRRAGVNPVRLRFGAGRLR
jgi:hypothetical protein